MNSTDSWFKNIKSIFYPCKKIVSQRNTWFGFVLGLSLCTPVLAGWEVQWIDRFEGTGVNWDNWTAQIQANYNNEVQCYTDDDNTIDKNYDVSNGTLKIIARRQDVSCPGLGGQQRSWTSGRLNSKDKSEFLYGRIESRIRFLDLEGGTWPAFWMLENRISEAPVMGDNDTVNWPNPGAGEIDIWEWFSNDAGSYITNFFNTNNCGGEFRPSYAGGASDVQDFHTYAIEWDANDIRFYMDDTVVVTRDVSSCAQYKESMFVLLNVAIGGNLGGTVDPTLDLATMEVDYVAHCVASSDNNLASCNESTPAITDDDGDGVSNSIDDCPATATDIAVGPDGCELVSNGFEPQDAAPVPSAAAGDVISLFSDAYNNVTDIDYNPNWGQQTVVTQVDVAGDNTLRYVGLNYQGTDFDANHQNVTAMHSLHVDYWTANTTELSLFLISPGPVETAYTFAVEQNTWVSEDIPLSAFADVDLSNVFQLKVVGNGTVFLDNLYFRSDDAVVNVDTDNDGVPDGDDLCADTASGDTVDVTGCVVDNPAPAPVPITPAPSSSGGGGSTGGILIVLFVGLFFRRSLKKK